MVLDILHLPFPPAIIHAERFQAAVTGNLVEAGLRKFEQSATCSLLQPEFEERRRLLRIVYF
jgi:hypothetical protein